MCFVGTKKLEEKMFIEINQGKPNPMGNWDQPELFSFNTDKMKEANVEAKETELKHWCHCKHQEIWERFRCQRDTQHELWCHTDKYSSCLCETRRREKLS